MALRRFSDVSLPGGMATIMAGLAAPRDAARKTVQLLSWLCLDPQVTLVVRLHNSATLDRMSGLKHLSRLLMPDRSEMRGERLFVSLGEVFPLCLVKLHHHHLANHAALQDI